MRKVIKNNYKIMIGIIIGIIVSVTTVYAVESYIESNKVTYNNHNKENVQEALDELYEKSGIHKEKWADPILNGADPVLKDPLIPVTIDNDGNVYYANLNSEWYNYSEKRWANAIILIDNPSNKNYGVGDQIKEDDIESYFVWIPRYQYKVWDLGNYNSVIDGNTITNTNKNLYQLVGKEKVIDIRFGTYDKYPKMTEPSTIGVYYTHPAFTLGNNNLNGIWVGKFETGYKGAVSTKSSQVNNEEPDSVIIKPNVYSWRYINVKNIFMTSYNYERGLDSHMLKNTEWGAIAYLSHSAYGLGNKININNAKYKTGFSATSEINQKIYPSDSASSDDSTKTQPWNSSVGYLASTTGNISGVYDIVGGLWEYMAAYSKDKLGDSNFLQEEINAYVNAGYIDKYSSDSKETDYNNRILGDATGELGPFYSYFESNGNSYNHSSWYSDYAFFINSTSPWFSRGGNFNTGILGGQFYFTGHTGNIDYNTGFRLVLAPSN